MRIYAVADIHGRSSRLGRIEERIDQIKPDVLIVAGDITHFTKPGPVIERLGRVPAPVLAIRGNTDLKRVEHLLAQNPHMESLDGRIIKVKGASFVGVSGTVPVPFRSRICMREKSALKKIEPFVDEESILVAHPPPWGILDQVLQKFNAGSKNLKRFVCRHRPKLLICGHIHETPGQALLDRTRVVNCALSRRGEGAVIDYEKGREPQVEMLRPNI